MIWDFLNSPLGITLVVGLISTVLGYIFKKKPHWENVYDEHKALFFDAVRHAEKAIPDSKGGALAKVDAALKYVELLEPKVAVDKKTAIKALDKAHKETKHHDLAKLKDLLKDEDGA